MKDSIRRRLEKTVERFEEVAALLADAEVIGKPGRFRDLSVEYARIEPVAAGYREFVRLEAERRAAAEMATGADAEMRELAELEVREIDARLEHEAAELTRLLVPKDPRDESNIFLEIRAGTGGDEAAIFAGDLFRMYARYAERQGWRVEVLSENPGEHGGYREIISRVVGKGAYSRLKFESGTHRVQRVPATEAQGRIHTSACTVAVLPEADPVADITINPADLRIDTFRASGAGGQHVNKTDSAVRITHLPTGIVVECQDDRSQHRNRAQAMAVLATRLVDKERSERQAKEAAHRKSLVGSGDRSERIRTYNWPQNRVTDHRLGQSFSLELIVAGRLTPLVEALDQMEREQRIQNL